METTKTHAVHGGTLRYLKHDSATTGTPMTLSVFVPGGEGPVGLTVLGSDSTPVGLVQALSASPQIELLDPTTENPMLA